AFAESVARALGHGLEWAPASRAPGRTTPAGGARTLSSPTLTLRQPRGGAKWSWLAVGAAVATLLTGAVVAAKRRGASAPARAQAPLVVRTTPLVTVELQSIPSGAEILDERAARLGMTPFEFVLPAGAARKVRFQKVGFRPVERRVDAVGDTTIAVRLDADASAPRARGRATRARAATDVSNSATIDPFDNR
ncbi:MAG TPA: hypothetical protein VG319_03500, partial [Polyangia bacterium]|nr:hypothetical protein [Polyangia bacterium]